MATRHVSILWDGPDGDVLSLLPEPYRSDFGADPEEEHILLAYYRLFDEYEEANGDIVGVEIVGFLTFDRWHVLESVPDKWQIEGDEPQSMTDLLRGLQATLRERAKVAAHA